MGGLSESTYLILNTENIFDNIIIKSTILQIIMRTKHNSIMNTVTQAVNVQITIS
jgi:hypothetical protein